MSRSLKFAPFIIGLIAIALTVIAVTLIYSSEPVAQKDGATKRNAMPVSVVSASVSQYAPVVKAMGQVVPARQVSLRPRVTGTVEAVSDKFVPGSLIQKGQWLVKLDSEDYQLALQRAKAELARAQSRYDIEMGEQEVARDDFAALKRDVAPMNRSLILRKPQLQQVEADLQTAKVAVREAELALERTTIRMPFDGQVMSQDVNLGSQLSSSDIIATVVGTARYWVEVALPLSQLQWLESAEGDRISDHGAEATIFNKTAWPQGAVRKGIVREVIAALDPQTRMATVLVEVNDPLGITAGSRDSATSAGQAPLLAGSYVEVSLPARTLTNVVRVPINYLRKNNTVWVADEQTLAVKEVSVAYRDEQYAYVNKGLNSGDQIITTNLATVTDGTAVQIKEETVSTSSSENRPHAPATAKVAR
ncbi:efflux RND transporter periplasmic adaptor subunit [Alteromonas halophila]|uniref:Membrane protein n=1 Tax=Alteromonas halophila TaxID=516698 RepID=A0A918JGT1_9ALTE|nr:efflux RND transporter periplasmic adaptor subunit [Alteromonas halophila]GGW76393.1 membrane protein [Alteromonas halophila]